MLTKIAGMAAGAGAFTALTVPSRTAQATPGTAPHSVHVNDYGAVPLDLNAGIPGDAAAFRAANTAAIQAALDDLLASCGGELILGPGVYHTDGAVGFNKNIDLNIGIVMKGAGFFPAMIWSNESAEPCFWLHTTTGNIRSFVMENLVLRGGKHNLSLHRAAYNRFNNVWFWGLGEWGIHSYLGQQNQYNNCSFAEVAASGSDSALFISCSHVSLNGCTYGELGGGIVGLSSTVTVNGGSGYGAWYQGNEGYRWDTVATVALGIGTTDESAFTAVGGYLTLTGLSFGLGRAFVTTKSSYALIVTGCRVRSGSSPSTPIGSSQFKGFINVYANPLNRISLVVTGNSFHFRGNPSAGDSGYVIKQPSSASFEGCVLANNVFSADANASFDPPSVAAPSLCVVGNGNITNNVIKLSTGSMVDC